MTLKTALLGDLLLTASETELTGVFFADCEHAARRREGEHNPKQPVLRRAAVEILEYLKGARTNFSVPLRCEGTDFQREVWRQIALIPFGETITYGTLAERAGNSRAVRAAGTATGRNPIGIIIPCHRVVGKHGALGGYAGGLARKRRLLKIELNPMAA